MRCTDCLDARNEPELKHRCSTSTWLTTHLIDDSKCYETLRFSALEATGLLPAV